MAADASIRSVGFWRGFLTGILVAALGLLVLALAYPPVPATPPDVDPEAAVAPPPPVPPAARPVPATGILGPAAPGPLVSDRPRAADAARAPGPSLVPLGPPPTAASGPSLTPLTPN